MRHSETLTGKQAQAIAALLQCHTVDAAAEQVGINRRTLHRWLNDPAFVAALNDAKAELTRHGTRRLAGALGTSITTVIHLAESSEDESVRLRAALAISTMLRELSDHADFAERLAAIEERLGHTQQENDRS